MLIVTVPITNDTNNYYYECREKGSLCLKEFGCRSFLLSVERSKKLFSITAFSDRPHFASNTKKKHLQFLSTFNKFNSFQRSRKL